MSTNTIFRDFAAFGAVAVQQDIQLGRAAYYYTLGRTQPWDNIGDTPPSSIAATPLARELVREAITYMSRIKPNDVALAIKRLNWTSGTVYERFNDQHSMRLRNFFVVTSNNEVFKCLDFNGGAASTVMPTKSYENQITADGYVWKYMYSIPDFQAFKFMSTTLMPVFTSSTDYFNGNGGLTDVTILNSGSGYGSLSSTTISIGATTGVAAELIPYLDSNGTITRVEIVNGGTNYTTAPVLTVNGAGTKLYASTSGSVALLEAIVNGGVIVNVLIRDPGVGYVSDNTTSITIRGDGTGAVLTPVVVGGEIRSVIIENAGEGYSFVELTINGFGSGAVLRGIVGLTTPFSDQLIVEQTVTIGDINAMNITNGGAGYLSAPAVAIVGDGTGATAVATITNGVVTKINMVTFGSGYSNATVTLDAPPFGGTQATAAYIRSPDHGHGAFANYELFSTTLCFSSVITLNETLAKIDQDFRQYAIIRGPEKRDGTGSATINNDLTCFEVVMADTSDLEKDMILTFNNGLFAVISFDATNVILTPITRNATIPIGTITTQDNLQSFVISEVISSPVINKYTGENFMVSSDTPYKFSAEQTIALKTFLSFS